MKKSSFAFSSILMNFHSDLNLKPKKKKIILPGLPILAGLWRIFESQEEFSSVEIAHEKLFTKMCHHCF